MYLWLKDIPLQKERITLARIPSLAMGSLYDEAAQGTLNIDRLKRYLNNPSALRAVGGPDSLTPLAAACVGGHLATVRLLLENGADPNGLSSRNRTPLFLATTASIPRNRAAIVRALLDGHAKVDLCYPETGKNTPLMSAILECKDKEVIHELVDHGASLTKENLARKTARQLAKENGLEEEILPKDQRNSLLPRLINLIVTFIAVVVAYINNPFLNKVVDGVIKDLQTIKLPSNDQEIKDTIKDEGIPEVRSMFFAIHIELIAFTCSLCRRRILHQQILRRQRLHLWRRTSSRSFSTQLAHS